MHNSESRLGIIGAPHSSKGEGIAHPGGRFDVHRRSAGNGHSVIDAHLGMLLTKCGTREEAYKFVIRDVADAYFDDMEGKMAGVTSLDQAVERGVPRIMAQRHLTGSKVKKIITRV